MATTDPSLDASQDLEGVVCAVDGSCGDSGCGCVPASRSDHAASPLARRGLKAGLLAAACVLGCLAVPLAVGGAAAVSGALAGEWWLVAGLVVAVGVLGLAASRRRHRGGKLC